MLWSLSGCQMTSIGGPGRVRGCEYAEGVRVGCAPPCLWIEIVKTYLLGSLGIFSHISM